MSEKQEKPRRKAQILVHRDQLSELQLMTGNRFTNSGLLGHLIESEIDRRRRPPTPTISTGWMPGDPEEPMPSGLSEQDMREHAAQGKP